VGRRGFTLIETLVALLLGLLLATLALRAISDVRKVAGMLARRGEALDALRTARHVMSRELRAGGPLVLAGAPASDSVGLRALRGMALACPGSVAGAEWVVVADGERAPDPDKDSTWILSSDGVPAVLAIVRSDPAAPCPVLGPGGAMRWTMSADLPRDPALALYFERGSYHLSGAALRYRRGDAGRQPLTPEVLRAPPSRFEGWGGSVAVRLVAADSGAPARSVVPFVAPMGGGGG